ncbi:MAG: polysaccharide deacetylase family protein [Bdellovibrionaceae bacterium]|nr:polysaccharide deacetylase family protein [Pseudobdellovibrionaceae bacterium]
MHPLITRKEVAKDIISVLEKHKVEKVFGFMNGSLAHGMSERLEILSLWKKQGFSLGNHTYSHLDLTKTSSSEFRNEPKQIFSRGRNSRVEVDRFATPSDA